MNNVPQHQTTTQFKLSPPVALIDCAKEMVTGFIRRTVLERRLHSRDGVRLTTFAVKTSPAKQQEAINPTQRTIYLSDPPETLLDQRMAWQGQ
jgi:hypothetical protein